jgi:acetylornithine deacetylase/succinyl-diaminopimelate desuccinylase-like protein
MFGPPSVYVGRISGGVDVYTVPEWCAVEGAVRYAPGTQEAIMERLRQQLAWASTPEMLPAARIAELAISTTCDAAAIAGHAPLVQELLSCVRELDPTRGPVTFPGGCDARHFINRYGVPAVIFGPGDLAAAHGVDEYLPLDQWAASMRALAALIVRWCG